MALLNGLSVAVLLPFQTAWTLCGLPARIAGRVVGVAEGFVEGRVRRELRTAGRGAGAHGNGRVGVGRPVARGAKKVG